MEARRLSGTRDEDWTIGRLLEWTTAFFRERALDSPRLDAEVLLADVLACNRIDLYTLYDAEVTPNDRARFRALVKERAQGQPVAYLVGQREFFSISFAVNRHVLIPRPETEVLVSTVLGLVPDETAARILDIGTGSGAIAISVALHRESATIVAIDQSREALEVARGNAGRLDVLPRIDFREGDLFAPLDESERFDVIVSNPPYVPTGDIAKLERDVRDFEPHSALDGGADGLDCIRRLIAEAPARLNDDGWLAIEFGIDQHEPIRELFSATNQYQDLRFIADVARRPRVVVARLRSSPS